MGEIRLTRLRGRNGYDPPLDIPDDQAQEMLNVDLYEGQCGRKRHGSSADLVTFSSGGPFTQVVVSLITHVPTTERTMELFAIEASDGNAGKPVVGRKAASTQYAAVTKKDDITIGTSAAVMGVSFNGKLFFAGWDSSVNRAQVYDPATGTIRRVGLGTPAAPTGADDGGGGLSLSRSYKVAYTVKSGSVTLRRSELSPVLTRTISAKAGSTITKPATISEGETHWELYAADTATGTYYLIATTVVGTTTFDDTTASIDTTTAAPVAGTNLPPPSARFVASDGNRLLYYGAIETAAGDSVEPKNGRVWFTALLGAGIDSIGDDERIPIQSTGALLRYYIDIGENTGGEPKGLAGPLDGSMYAFQSNGITELTPTGRANTPYRRFQIKTEHGAVNQKSIVHAPDATGTPCIYFLSPKDGPRRISRDGIEWLGADVKDLWDVVNLDLYDVAAHGVYHADINQIWWWMAINSGGNPNCLVIYDVSEGITSVVGGMPAIRRGWTRFTGSELVNAWCSTMFSITPGATMAVRRKPYIGLVDSIGVTKCDTGTATCQALITTKEYELNELTGHAEVTGGVIVAQASTGVTLQATLLRDFGADSVSDTATLSAEGNETQVIRDLSELKLAEMTTASLQIGDASSIASSWILDEVVITVGPQEHRS